MSVELIRQKQQRLAIDMAKSSLISRRLRACVGLLVAVPFAIGVAGCSADDIELNGKIFDAVGLNNKSSSVEPRMAERAPLVMPPNFDRTPEPGSSGAAGAQSEVAALNDPDKTARTSRKELERQQAEYCKVNYEQAKARGDQNADSASGPLGLCRGSVLSAIKSWSNDDADEE